MQLMRPGRSFARLSPFVVTTLFHWFLPTDGNIRGPWLPLEGRAAWTGEADFWVGQIKQIMMANIDAVYVHCVDDFEAQRINFFKACSQLRREGWAIPKIAPFLDPYRLWGEKPINVSKKEGKDEFVRHYIRFFEQYLSQNEDDLAETDLLRIDEKVVLASWWAQGILQCLDRLSRKDIDRRLRAALGQRMRSLKTGTYMVSAALIDPDFTFSDERMIMFSGYSYAIHSVHKIVDVWHVQPGYWDQNLRKPGYLLPRDGGKHYRSAWEVILSNVPYVQRIYVESWNEYDEGSGIYAADPSAPRIDQAMHSNIDVFSDTNDPFEYINTTARGAARINGRRENDAAVLGVETPNSAQPGDEVDVRVVVRNEGNARWSGAAGYALRIGKDVMVPIDDEADEIPLYGGIFRGRPVTFTGRLPVGVMRGTVSTDISMVKDTVPFGETSTIKIEVR